MKVFQYCAENERVVKSPFTKCSNQIESAFGWLKGKWEILTKPIYLKLNTIPLIIYTCFVLHNYCKTKSSCVLDEEK